jgi:hypothetical protein
MKTLENFAHTVLVTHKLTRTLHGHSMLEIHTQIALQLWSNVVANVGIQEKSEKRTTPNYLVEKGPLEGNHLYF